MSTAELMGLLQGYWVKIQQYFNWAEYCVRHDIFEWSLNCREFWKWSAYVVAALAFVILVSRVRWALRKRLAIKRIRAREEARIRVADEETMKQAKWRGEELPAAELPLELLSRRIRQSMDMRVGRGGDISYYEVIGVADDASVEVIQAACLVMAARCRPDKNKDDMLAEQEFAELERIFETLTDAQMRAAYDATIQRGQ